MTRTLSVIAVALLAATAVRPEAQATRTLRIASLAPSRTVWDNGLQQMRSDWEKATAGRVRGLVYPSGQQGDERTVLLKLKSGTLDGAALALPGLCQIDEAFNVFGIPFFYDSYDELNGVIERLTPELRQRLLDRGFVLLGWGHAGWVRIFSTRPIRTLDDLRSMKMYTSAGDDRMVRVHQRHGLHPIALAETGILTGLASGMIEAVPTTPTAMLFMQWYSRAPYMLDVPVAPLVGATLVTRKAWDSLSEADRTAVADAGRRLEERLQHDIPMQDEESVRVMRRKGLTVAQAAGPEWAREGQRYADDMKAWVPDELFSRALRERDGYRVQHPPATR
jgi:TRAP-type C4-dicarboxylate transport system substrate-binding protein